MKGDWRKRDKETIYIYIYTTERNMSTLSHPPIVTMTENLSDAVYLKARVYGRLFQFTYQKQIMAAQTRALRLVPCVVYCTAELLLFFFFDY